MSACSSGMCRPAPCGCRRKLLSIYGLDRIRRPLRHLDRMHLPRRHNPARRSDRRPLRDAERASLQAEFRIVRPSDGAAALDRGAAPDHSTTRQEAQSAWSASASTSPSASAPSSSFAPSPKRWKKPSRSARGSWRRKTRPASGPRNCFARRRKWKPSASSPAASRTTSTIFSPSCWAAST